MRSEEARRGAGRAWVGAALGAATSLAVVLVTLAGWTAALDRPFEDLLLRARGDRTAHDRIALIEINDATLQAYGEWPIPRDQHALLLEALDAAEVQAVGFDLLFIGSDRYNVLNDDLLAAESGRLANVVHAMTFHQLDRAVDGATSVNTPVRSLERHALVGENLPVHLAGTPLLPYPLLLESTPALGHVAVIDDPDGVIRRVPLWLEWQGDLFPSFALRLSAFAHGTGWPPEIRREGASVRIRWADGRIDHFRVDDDGAVRIAYRGDRNAFPRTFAYVDVLRTWAAGDTASLRAAFHDRIVLIGSTATGEAAADVGVTPFSNSTPRVYAQANMLDGLLRGEVLHGPSRTGLAFGLLLFGIVFGAILARVTPLARLVMTMGSILVGGTVVGAVLYGSGLVLPPFAVLVLPPALLIAVGSEAAIHDAVERERVRRERATARKIQSALLPTGQPTIEDLDIYATNIPSRDVSGDYYDWMEGPEGQFIVALADVSGKGLPAALLAANLQASFRAHAGIAGRAPSQIVDAVHRALLASSPSNRFATMFVASIGDEDEDIHYCSAGHEPAFLIVDGSITFLEATGGAVGLFPDTRFLDRGVSFPPGAWLVVYSDGVSETPSPAGELGADGLSRLVLSMITASGTARGLGEAILSELSQSQFGSSSPDDATLLVVRRRSPGS